MRDDPLLQDRRFTWLETIIKCEPLALNRVLELRDGEWTSCRCSDAQMEYTALANSLYTNADLLLACHESPFIRTP